MSLVDSTAPDNPLSPQPPENSPAQIARRLEQLALGLRDQVVEAAAEGESFDSTERNVRDSVRQIGFEALELFVRLQGLGDLGEQVGDEQVGEGQDRKTLYRSEEPSRTVVRSIFGEHAVEQYTYAAGRKKAIELRPISARMQLPEHRWSYLLQEFSQMFCADQAFRQAAEGLETIFGSKFSVGTLEQINQDMGQQAGEFLHRLPTPPKEEEGEFLVVSADCKGVPLVREDAAQVAAFEAAKKRPGNRRMATVTSAYTVDPHERTAEQVVAALFRDERPNAQQPGASAQPASQESRPPRRPQPQSKHTAAHFPTRYLDGDTEIPISGIHEGIAWLAEQVAARRRPEQTLVLVMDGQESLWDVASLHFDAAERVVEILDLIHVSKYVWEASALFHRSREMREAFTRERLLKILHGEVRSVIRGLRRMGSLHNLRGETRKDLRRICGYFEKHQHRMRYDKYLAAGYPIASGVIEGACGHLVKDRMERSGMRWTLEGARSMLNVRAVFQSDYWDRFQSQRIEELSARAHPRHCLVENYMPLKLAF